MMTTSKDHNKWPGELYFNSGNLLFMQADSEIKFYPEDESVKIDYSKNKEEILEDLNKLCYDPPCKFMNFNTAAGHVVETFLKRFFYCPISLERR